MLNDLRSSFNIQNDFTSNIIGNQISDFPFDTGYANEIKNDIISEENNYNDISCSRYNRPSYKKVGIDMPHIISGHGPNGNRGPNKDRFPWWMTSSMIEKVVRQ